LGGTTSSSSRSSSSSWSSRQQLKRQLSNVHPHVWIWRTSVLSGLQLASVRRTPTTWWGVGLTVVTAGPAAKYVCQVHAEFQYSVQKKTRHLGKQVTGMWQACEQRSFLRTNGTVSSNNK
jgi:hypothetical protein